MIIYNERYNLVRFSKDRVKTIILESTNFDKCKQVKENYEKTKHMTGYDYRIEQVSPKKLKGK